MVKPCTRYPYITKKRIEKHSFITEIMGYIQKLPVMSGAAIHHAFIQKQARDAK